MIDMIDIHLLRMTAVLAKGTCSLGIQSYLLSR